MAGLTLALCVAAVVSLTFSLLTPAWETNDEFQHIEYVEHIVETGAFPTITASNGWESAQPPLYYLAAAAWQHLLGIPAFHPTPLPSAPATTKPVHLELRHNYTSTEHQQAVWVHEIRLLSLLFEFVAVAATFFVALLATGAVSIATSTSLLAATIPKVAIVFGSVTNDVLVDAACAVALACAIAWVRTDPRKRSARLGWAAALGFTLGCAALTKYTGLPLALVLLVAIGGISWARRLGLRDAIVVALLALAVSGWWYVRNLVTYGDPLATHANETMLKHFFPGCLNISCYPLSDLYQWTVVVPKEIVQTFWYVGLWNQLTLPSKVSYALFLGAGAVILFALYRGFLGSRENGEGISRAVVALLVATLAAGVAAAYSIALVATQYQGRFTYVSLAAFVTLTTWGTSGFCKRRLGRFAGLGLVVWPTLMICLLGWVLAVDVLPLAGL